VKTLGLVTPACKKRDNPMWSSFLAAGAAIWLVIAGSTGARAEIDCEKFAKDPAAYSEYKPGDVTSPMKFFKSPIGACLGSWFKWPYLAVNQGSKPAVGRTFRHRSQEHPAGSRRDRCTGVTRDRPAGRRYRSAPKFARKAGQRRAHRPRHARQSGAEPAVVAGNECVPSPSMSRRCCCSRRLC
jgi:hypothetical protein